MYRLLKKKKKVKDIQQVQFFLTAVFLKDEKSGDYTAYYLQFPEASAQGRTKQEAQQLLDEIFPYLLADKKKEFQKYHHGTTKSVSIVDRPMTSV